MKKTKSKDSMVSIFHKEIKDFVSKFTKEKWELEKLYGFVNSTKIYIFFFKILYVHCVQFYTSVFSDKRIKVYSLFIKIRQIEIWKREKK